jgi:hypothetical protein
VRVKVEEEQAEMGTADVATQGMITLTGPENFTRWKIWCMRRLVGEGVWPAVEGNCETKDERRADCIAKAIIQASVSDEVLDHLSNSGTAAETWDTLEDIENWDWSQEEKIKEDQEGSAIPADEGAKRPDQSKLVQREIDPEGLDRPMIGMVDHLEPCNGDADSLRPDPATGKHCVPVRSEELKMRKRSHHRKMVRKKHAERRRSRGSKRRLRKTLHRKVVRKRQAFGGMTKERRRSPPLRQDDRNQDSYWRSCCDESTSGGVKSEEAKVKVNLEIHHITFWGSVGNGDSDAAIAAIECK